MVSNIVSVAMYCTLEKIMNSESWLERLEMLLVRFSHLGIGADVASLSLIELWALYCYLSRLGNG